MGESFSILILHKSVLFREALGRALGADDRFTVVRTTAVDEPQAVRAMKPRPDVVVIGGVPDGVLVDLLAALDLAPQSTGAVVLSRSCEVDDVACVPPTCTLEELIEAVIATDPRAAEHVADGHKHLSLREGQVLALVAKGMTNRQIANRLSIAEGTVKRHLRNIFAKLGAVSRIDAINKDRRRGHRVRQVGRATIGSRLPTIMLGAWAESATNKEKASTTPRCTR